jgi:hypothetical protein
LIIDGPLLTDLLAPQRFLRQIQEAHASVGSFSIVVSPGM